MLRSRAIRRAATLAVVASLAGTAAGTVWSPALAVDVPAAPDLQAASDTGTSATDNITKTSSGLAFTAAGADGDVLELLRGGVAVGSGTVAAGTVTLVDGGPVADGVHAYTVRNQGTGLVSTALSVTVDTVAAAPVMRLAAASDTGRSNSDGVTSTLNPATGTYATTLTLSVTGEAGAVLGSFTRKINSLSATARTFTGGATTLAIPTGTASVADAVSALASLAPANGSYLYSMVQTDVAGNVSGAGTTTVTVDTIAPALATITLDSTTDTGPSATDGVTRWDPASPAVVGGLSVLKINVAGEPNAIVELRRNGAVVTPPVSPSPYVLDGAGAGQFTEPGPFPFTGVHGYTATLADVAGNASTGANGITVDLDNPALPSKLDLVTSSDLGNSDSDDITSDNTPTVVITGVEGTATAFVYRCPGTSCTTANRVLLGTRLGSGEFTTPVLPDNSAANTSWRLVVGQRDLAGRFSGGQVSAAVVEPVGVSVHLNVVIDTVPEPAPAAPALVAGSITGLDAGPTRTSDVTPTFNVAKGTGRVQLLRNGVVVGTSVGAGDIDDPGPLADGTYTYTARSLDAAGNISALSDALVVTVGSGGGYWLLGRDGGVFAFGSAPFHGSTGGMKLNAPVLSLTPTPSRGGYWLLARDGGVFSFGDAEFFGSTGGMVLQAPVVAMAATPSGQGYWLFAQDGGVFAFGDAVFLGSSAGKATAAIVAAQVAPDGLGYWLADSKGRVYAHGSAAPLAGVDGTPLSAPIVGMAATPTGAGLWLVGADGGIFTLGDAAFLGSAGGLRLAKPIVGMLASPAGNGYLLIGADGGVFAYGAASFRGTTAGMALAAPIVGVAAV